MQEDFDFEAACRYALNEFRIETADGRHAFSIIHLCGRPSAHLILNLRQENPLL